MAEKNPKLSTLSTLNKTPVKIVPHSFLNFLKEGVYCRMLMHYSVEELPQELAKQEVMKGERMSRKPDTITQPIPTLFITFD